MRNCSICAGKYFAKGMCKTCYYKLRNASPKRKAWVREFNQRPKRKAYMYAYSQRPEQKAYQKERRNSILGKAYKKEYDQRTGQKTRLKAYEQLPERKAYRKVRDASPKKRAYDKIWKRSRKGRILSLKHSNKRRSLGHEIINPEFANEPGFHGHHIDHNHVLYIPKSLHESIRHSLKRPETIERINTAAFAWLLGVLVW